MTKPVEEKRQRLLTGAAPRVLDLFSGCGGLTLGFVSVGAESIGGVEIDADAAMSHARNFHASVGPDMFATHARARDITVTGAEELLREFGFSHPDRAVDIVVGGPPCPAFTRVGRAKLREVNQHPEAFRHDPRAQLYLPYLEYVKRLKPLAIIMENVPDVLNWGGHNLAEEICEVLEQLGYICRYTLLNAVNYGVPQMRERFFLFAVHETAEALTAFPKPTHFMRMPPGYEGSRAVALKLLKEGDLFAPPPRYLGPPEINAKLASAVTVAEAIGDLPEIYGHLDGSITRGARRMDQGLPYEPPGPVSQYARAQRRWHGFEGKAEIFDHVIRSLSSRSKSRSASR